MRCLALRTAVFSMLLAASMGALACGGDGKDTDSDGKAASAPVAGTQSTSRTAGRALALQRVGNFDEPLYVTSPPGDRKRVFVVEKTGRIRVLVGGRRARRPFLDLSSEVSTGGEQGLLSMAFAPNYAKTGRFYVDFTDRNGNTRVQEFERSRRDPNRANRAGRRAVLFVAQPFENHNGGLVLFGPDQLLYIGLGDGGAAGDPGNRAQNLDVLLGKILRIDPRKSGASAYRSPGSNPFVGKAGRDEIYAYGLRNPWRFSFDRETGDLYIGDVGQNRFEEVDYAPRGDARGRNYGWSCFEGTAPFDTSRRCSKPNAPIHTYSLTGGNCAVTGGVVVRDPGLPRLLGSYLYGDFCRGQLRSFRVIGRRAVGDHALGLHVASLSSFGEDAGGRVYLTSLEGPIYRLVAR